MDRKPIAIKATGSSVRQPVSPRDWVRRSIAANIVAILSDINIALIASVAVEAALSSWEAEEALVVASAAEASVAVHGAVEAPVEAARSVASKRKKIQSN